MLSLELKNLHSIDPAHGLSEKEINEKSNLISQYLDQIHKKDQGFYKIPDDAKTIKKILKFTQENKGKYEHIIVLGIGGSALGTICLQNALTHLYKNTSPSLHILDNIDPVIIKEIEDIIDYKKTLFLCVTKSGTTPETIAQFFYFSEKIKEKNLKIKDHFVFVTDPEKGFLRDLARKEDITAFEIPENIGGRFSVLTPVGLLPAALIGIDIKKLIHGAANMRDKFLNENFETNTAYKLALIKYLLYKKNKKINVLMPYAQKLSRFADWYIQLIAESLGKTENIGITPIKALGATDQHSQNQLFNDGPNDKLIIFLEVENLGEEIEIPIKSSENYNFDYLKNISFNKLLATEKFGTEQALTQNNRPNITIKINQIDEKNLGALFLLFEGATAFLGELFKINAFDQPGVELSKQLTKKILMEK